MNRLTYERLCGSMRFQRRGTCIAASQWNRWLGIYPTGVTAHSGVWIRPCVWRTARTTRGGLRTKSVSFLNHSFGPKAFLHQSLFRSAFNSRSLHTKHRSRRFGDPTLSSANRPFFARGATMQFDRRRLSSNPNRATLCIDIRWTRLWIVICLKRETRCTDQALAPPNGAAR